MTAVLTAGTGLLILPSIPVEAGAFAVAGPRHGFYNDFAATAKNLAGTGFAVSAVGGEVAPISSVEKRRNEHLKELGYALAELSQAQANFSTEGNSGEKQPTCVKTAELVNSLSPTRLMDDNGDVTKADCETAIQFVKARMDRLNNDSQVDRTRLPVLVNLQQLI